MQGGVTMLYNIDFAFAGIIILCIVLATYYSKKQMPTIQNKHYVRLMIVTFSSLLLDILCGVVESHSQVAPTWLLMFTNMAYFAVRFVLIYQFTLYILSLSGKYHSRTNSYKWAVRTPVLVALAVVVITPFTGFLFYFNQNNEYTRGVGIAFKYVFTLGYMAFAIIYTLYNQNHIAKRVRYAVYCFIVFSLISIYIQFNNYFLLIEGFGIAVCVLMLYMAIQRPEEFIDSETQLMNKQAFNNIIKSNFDTGKSFCVISIALNDYAAFNKALGVSVYASIVMQVRNYLVSIAKKNIVYSIAPHQFCIVMDNAESQQALSTAQSALSRFKMRWHSHEIAVKLSAKVCMISCPSCAKTGEELTEIIEAANHVKSDERVFNVSEMKMDTISRNSCVKLAVEKALEQGGFEVYYQPIYCSKTGKIRSAEALIRLNDSELGFVPPDEFIPIAEESGSILHIGRFVINSVCRFYAENNLQERGVEFIDVNLSAVECMQDNLTTQLGAVLKKHKLEHKRINIEITETAQAYSLDIFKTNVARLNESGFTLSLDDYGTGYSTIEYIINLPFKTVKIDKSIVKSSGENAKSKAVVKSVIKMIKKLDMDIVAEGVETKQQADDLTQWGCEYLQGFYFSKAVPENEFLNLLNNN